MGAQLVFLFFFLQPKMSWRGGGGAEMRGKSQQRKRKTLALRPVKIKEIISVCFFMTEGCWETEKDGTLVSSSYYFHLMIYFHINRAGRALKTSFPPFKS